MTRKLKKVLALLLTLSMVMSMVTVTSLAAEEEHRYCSFCAKNSLVRVEQVDPTCQEEGVKAHWYCPLCKRNFHNNTAGVPNVYVGKVDRIPVVSCDYSVPATCTSPATCKWCGKADPNGQVDPSNHTNVVIDPALEPTCTGTGLTEGSHCAACDTVIVAQSGVPSKGHKVVNVEAVPATCLAAGTTAGTKCSTCGTILSGVEADPQKDHSYTGAYVDKGDEGHAQKCVNGCDQVGETVAHSGNWVVTKDATCTAKGEETQTCVCRHVATRETNMLDHKDEDHNNKCDDCGATICEHDLQVVSTTPATCTTGTITVEKCTKCEYTKTTEADDAGHTYGELIAEQAATCTVDGVKAHYVCSVCEKLFDENKEETTEEALVIKAPGTHTWTEGAVNTETYERVDTCEKGDATRTVSLVARIGDVYFETLQAAIDTAEDGDTVEVMKDCTGAALIEAKSITLHIPEGVTVSTNTGKNYALAVAGEGAELTITGEGTVQGSTYGVVAQEKGTLNVAGGTVNGSYGIQVTGGTLNVTDGIVKGKYAIRGMGGFVTVTGGTVEGSNRGISLSRGASATISGTAKIEGVTCGVAVIGLADTTTAELPDNTSFTKLTVNGGTIIGSTYYGITGNGSDDGTIIEINGGTITGNYTAIYHPQVGDMTITGGEIAGPNGVQYSGAGNLTITGGKITATLPLTNAPQKPETQNDGTVQDGAALSIVSRGGGWQNEGEVMDVTVTGGEFISENNSAVAVYRIAKVDGKWQVGNDTGLDSYLNSLTITGGKFTGNVEKGVLDIEALAMDAKSITGGYFSEDIDAGNINYVDEGFEAHPVSTYEGYFHVHQPDFAAEYLKDETNHWKGCQVNECLEGKVVEAHTFGEWIVDTPAQVGVEGSQHHDCTVCSYRENDTIPALERPTPDPEPDTTTYYTLTIRYVDAQGNQVAPTATRRLAEGSRYTVDSPAVEGMTPDQETVTGILNSRTEITVTYAADENVDDNQTPTTEAPETSEPTETQKPDETQPPETEEPGETEDLGENDTPLTETPDETEDLGDNDTPLADVPQTGDMLWLWILLAVVSASGLIWISLEEKKGRRVA